MFSSKSVAFIVSIRAKLGLACINTQILEINAYFQHLFRNLMQNFHQFSLIVLWEIYKKKALLFEISMIRVS